MMQNRESRIDWKFIWKKLETHLVVLIRSSSQKFGIAQYLRFKNLKTIKKDINKLTKIIAYTL